MNRQARIKVSTGYWIKYKRTSANLHQIIKDSKRKFWDAACEEAPDVVDCVLRPTLILISF